MQTKSRTKTPSLLLWGAAFCAFIAAIPLVYLAIRIGGAGASEIIAILSRLRTWETVAISVGLAVVVVVACLAISYPTALFLTRTKMPLRRFWFTTVALPLAIPSYVAAYAWVALIPGMNGFWAAAMVLTAVSFPYVLLPLLVSLRSADMGLEQVARSLGEKPMAAFFATSFRQSVPAAAAGSLLVALYVLSDFGAVALLRVDAFTRVIYTSYRASFDRSNAAVLAGMLVILAVILISLERKARGRSLRFRADKGVASITIPKALTPASSALSLMWFIAIAVISLGIPIVSLLIRLSEGTRRPLDWGELASAAVNTAWISALGAVIAVLLALPIAALASTFRSKSTSSIESLSYSGLALPGVVIGLSLVFLSINTVPFLYQSFVLLAFAYAVLFLPKSLGASRSALEAVPPALGQVAQTLGYHPLRAWLYTSGRISLPGIAAGGLLVMLTAMKELPATLMLRPTGFDTLATELWSRTELAAFGAAAPYALALILLAAVPSFALSRGFLTSEKETMVNA
jgi:iron(III) transport system permease protein